MGQIKNIKLHIVTDIKRRRRSIRGESGEGSRRRSTMAHHLFRARTVMVGSGGAEIAYAKLQRVMMNEGLMQAARRNRYNEKPTQRRMRIRYEQSLAVNQRDLRAKTEMVMRLRR